MKHLTPCRISIPLCMLVSTSWMRHVMEKIVYRMNESFDQGYVNQTSFYVCLHDSKGHEKEVQRHTLSPVLLLGWNY